MNFPRKSREQVVSGIRVEFLNYFWREQATRMRGQTAIKDIMAFLESGEMLEGCPQETSPAVAISCSPRKT